MIMKIVGATQDLKLGVRVVLGGVTMNRYILEIWRQEQTSGFNRKRTTLKIKDVGKDQEKHRKQDLYSSRG